MGRQNCVRVVLYRRSGAGHLFFFQEYGPFGHGWCFGTLLILYAGIAPSGHVATQARARFLVNLKAAKAMGSQLAAGLVLRADKVIE